MGSHPLNLFVRLVLELAAVIGLGLWGWSLGTGVERWLLAATAPLVAALAWGAFNVPGDPSRSGRAPIVVPGWLRLTLELAILAAATVAWFRVVSVAAGRTFGGVTILHYAASYDRIRWLLRQ